MLVRALLSGVPLVLSAPPSAPSTYGAFDYEDVRGLSGYGFWGPPRGMGREYLKTKVCARDVRPDGRAVRMTVALKEPGTPTTVYVDVVNHRGVGSTSCSSLVSLGAEWMFARGGTIDRRGLYRPGPWHRLR
jgi:hypothetical protein